MARNKVQQTCGNPL